MKRKHTDGEESGGSVADSSDEGEAVYFRVGGADESESDRKLDCSDCEDSDAANHANRGVEDAEDVCGDEGDILNSDGSDYASDDLSGGQSDDDALSMDDAIAPPNPHRSDELVLRLARYIVMFKDEPPQKVDFSFPVMQPFREYHLPHWREFVNVLNSPDSPGTNEIVGEGWVFRNIELPGEVVHLLRTTFTNRRISSLNLSNNNCGREGIRFISSLLENNRIDALELVENEVENMEDASRLVDAIGNHASLDTLHIGGMDLEAKWGLLLMILRSCGNISIRLNLSSNNIGSKGMAVISEFIATNPKVYGLYLNHNKIADEDMPQIAEALKRNTKMGWLELDPVSHIGQSIIDRALFDMSSLNAVSDSNHTLEAVWQTRHLGCGTTYNKMNAYTEPKKNRRTKIFAAICCSYQRNKLGNAMDNVTLELMPRVLELIQQDIDDIWLDAKYYSLWHIDDVLCGDDAVDLSFVGCSDTFIELSSQHHNDESSSGTSSNSSFHSLDEDLSDCLSYDSSDSEEDENPYLAFDLSLMFEILRGWTMPMIASDKDQAKIVV